MSIKDLSKAWDEAALHALASDQSTEIDSKQLTAAAGLRVRSGIAAGFWGLTDVWMCGTDHCTQGRCLPLG